MNKKLSLNKQILITALVGIGIGIYLNTFGQDFQFKSSILYVSQIVGKGIFLNLLKMIIIPLVFTSIVVGIANLRAHREMGKVWKLTLVYFLSTTALAIILGLIVVNIFRPGSDVSISFFDESMRNFTLHSMSLPEYLREFVSGLFINPFKATAEGAILPTIIFAIFMGIGLVIAGDTRARTLLAFFNEFFEISMMIVSWIMKLLPYGLCALLIDLFASQDRALFLSLGKFMIVVIGATLFHGFVSLPVLLLVVVRKNPKQYFSGVREALITAFSTSSSSATLPITMKCVTNNLKVDKDIAGFVLPLGATMNMDGTALYEAIAALFVANLVGIDLTIIQQITVFFTAMIASIGAPGIPSAGLVTLMMVLQSVGLPVEAVAILIPIDRILDAFRTAVNVEGDTIGSSIVEKFAGKRKG